MFKYELLLNRKFFIEWNWKLQAGCDEQQVKKTQKAKIGNMGQKFNKTCEKLIVRGITIAIRDAD